MDSRDQSGGKLKFPSRISTLIFQGTLLAVGLAVLALLLVPWPGINLRDAARGTQALSNAKQIATAIGEYASDHDDGWPLLNVKGKETALGWAGRLNPYLRKNKFIGIHSAFVVAEDSRLPPSPDGFPISFAMNANVARSPTASKLVRPETSILLFEVAHARSQRDERDARGKATRLSPVGDGTPTGLRDSLQPGLAPEVRYALGRFPPPWDIGPRRKYGTALAFADGHVRLIRPDRIADIGRKWKFALE